MGLGLMLLAPELTKDHSPCSFPSPVIALSSDLLSPIEGLDRETRELPHRLQRETEVNAFIVNEYPPFVSTLQM